MGVLSRLRDTILGGRVKAAVPQGRVIPGLSLQDQHLRIGGNLTPLQVSNIFSQADLGQINRLVDLSNEARQKDCHLQSCLHTRETALAALPWTITAFKERDDKEPADRDRDIAWFCEDALTAAAGDGQEIRSLTDTVSQLVGGVYHGHAVDEIDWRRDGKHITPAGFIPVDQRRFAFRRTDGKLVWDDSHFGGSAGVDLPSEFPGQFLQHQPRVNGDIPAREGLSRVLNWSALFRNWDISDWLKLAELSWKPWRVGKYPSGKQKGTSAAGDKDRDDLLEILQELTTNGIAAIRDDWELDFKGIEIGAGMRGVHEALARFMGAEMSKAILGQTLTTEQGDRGARSLGEVHDRVRKDIREYDAISVAATLQRDLIRPLVWMNFGPETPLPLFAFSTDDAVDLVALSEALEKFTDPIDGSTPRIAITQKWVRDQAGIPNPEEDEPLVGQPMFEIEVDVSDLDAEAEALAIEEALTTEITHV